MNFIELYYILSLLLYMYMYILLLSLLLSQLLKLYVLINGELVKVSKWLSANRLTMTMTMTMKIFYLT